MIGLDGEDAAPLQQSMFSKMPKPGDGVLQIEELETVGVSKESRFGENEQTSSHGIDDSQ